MEISSLFLILIATKYSIAILQYSMQLWKSRKHPREGFCINHKMPTSGQSDEPFPRNQLKTDFQWNDNPEITILTDGRRLCKEKFGPVETPVPDNQSNPIQHQWCCNRGHSKIWNFSLHFVTCKSRFSLQWFRNKTAFLFETSQPGTHVWVLGWEQRQLAIIAA